MYGSEAHQAAGTKPSAFLAVASGAAGDADVDLPGRTRQFRLLAVRVPAVRERGRGRELHPARHVGLQLLHQGLPAVPSPVV